MGERTAGGGDRGAPAAGEVPAADDALCRAFLQGDEAAFGELLRRHQALVYALVRRYAARPEDARDLAQKAFLRAFEAARRTLPRLTRGGGIPFKAWLARIAVNLGKNHARQASRWRLAPVTALDGATGSAPSAADALERAERERQARAAVLSLPRRQREVLTLRIDGGLSFQEIADALGITANNAKVHFHHAVQKLRTAVIANDSDDSNNSEGQRR
jgi:RNA polymerase sigma-70 factor (ECF subfamily)